LPVTYLPSTIAPHHPSQALTRPLHARYHNLDGKNAGSSGLSLPGPATLDDGGPAATAVKGLEDAQQPRALDQRIALALHHPLPLRTRAFLCPYPAQTTHGVEAGGGEEESRPTGSCRGSRSDGRAAARANQTQISVISMVLRMYPEDAISSKPMGRGNPGQRLVNSAGLDSPLPARHLRSLPHHTERCVCWSASLTRPRGIQWTRELAGDDLRRRCGEFSRGLSSTSSLGSDDRPAAHLPPSSPQR
jgi:hypothetical protein